MVMNTFVTFKIEDAMKTFRYILFVWVMLGCGLLHHVRTMKWNMLLWRLQGYLPYLTVSRALIRLILHSTS